MIIHLPKSFLYFVELKVSLPYSQESSKELCLEWGNESPPSYPASLGFISTSSPHFSTTQVILLFLVFWLKHCVYFWTQLLCYVFCLCHSSLVYCNVGHRLLWNSIRVHAWVSLAFVFLLALSSAIAVCVHVCYYSYLLESSIHCGNTECFEIFALLGCYTA